MTLEFTTTTSENRVTEEQLAAIFENPGFGRVFTDHMVSIDWTSDRGWFDARVEPYGPLSIDPAHAVLHYGQEIFEGLKAYRHEDGSVWLFRPDQNAARLQRSAARMALPEVPADAFVEACKRLIEIDEHWVPSGAEQSLYLRPFEFGNEVFLGVRAAQSARFMVIASPVGAYFADGVKPVRIWLSEQHNRAGKGGTGAAKTGGNYASSLLPTQEAFANGCSQVLFLSSQGDGRIDELGGMNLVLVRADGTLITPKSDTILDGVTRNSLLELAQHLGHKVEHRPVTIDEWRNGVADGSITEAFACGTAAVITPINEIVSANGSFGWPDAEPGEVTMKLRRSLNDIQWGRADDPFGWMVQVTDAKE